MNTEEKVLGDARTALIDLLQKHREALMDLRTRVCDDVSKSGRKDIRDALNEVFRLSGQEFDRVQQVEKSVGKALRSRKANVRPVK